MYDFLHICNDFPLSDWIFPPAQISPKWSFCRCVPIKICATIRCLPIYASKNFLEFLWTCADFSVVVKKRLIIRSLLVV